MDLAQIGIAAVGLTDDLLVGGAIGGAIGFLAGPILRHRLAYRAWRDASREADLADELIARLEELDDADRHRRERTTAR
jgi:hypothetical protein